MFSGALVGSASGYLTGFVLTFATTGSLREAHKTGIHSAKMGAVLGGISGGIAGYRYAKEHKISPWKGEKTQKHHSYPKFMGGEDKQSLSPINQSRHQDLHQDLNNYLRNLDIERGDGLRMQPVRGNPGFIIQENFSPDIRFNTIKGFYDSYPFKYFDIRRKFYHNNGLEWRLWPPKQ